MLMCRASLPDAAEMSFLVNCSPIRILLVSERMRFEVCGRNEALRTLVASKRLLIKMDLHMIIQIT
jgi:hypothetical protein